MQRSHMFLVAYTPRAGRRGGIPLLSSVAKEESRDFSDVFQAVADGKTEESTWFAAARKVRATSRLGEDRDAKEMLILHGPLPPADSPTSQAVTTRLSARCDELGKLIETMGDNGSNFDTDAIIRKLDEWEVDFRRILTSQRGEEAAPKAPGHDLDASAEAMTRPSTNPMAAKRGAMAIPRKVATVALILLGVVLVMTLLWEGGNRSSPLPVTDTRQRQFEADLAAAAGMDWNELSDYLRRSGRVPQGTTPEGIRRLLEEKGAVETIGGKLRLVGHALLPDTAREQLRGISAIQIPANTREGLAAWRERSAMLIDWIAQWRSTVGSQLCPAFRGSGKSSTSRTVKVLANLTTDGHPALVKSQPSVTRAAFMTVDDVANAVALESLISSLSPPEDARRAIETFENELENICRSNRKSIECTCGIGDRLDIEDGMRSLYGMINVLLVQQVKK